jgi:hypothetical protein
MESGEREREREGGREREREREGNFNIRQLLKETNFNTRFQF